MNQLVMARRQVAYRELLDRLYDETEVEYFNRGYGAEEEPPDTAAADTTVDGQAGDSLTAEGI
jgi:hypothetical protein